MSNDNKPKLTATSRAVGILLSSVFLLSACADLPREATKPSIPELDSIELDPSKAIGADKESKSWEIETQLEDVFILKPVSLSQQDPLPFKKIESMSFNDAALSDVLRLLIADLPISLSISNPSNNNQTIYGSVVSYGLSGPLSKVLESIAQSVGFYYSYKDGILNITPDEQFIVVLPPLASDELFSGINNTIVKLGGFDSYLDRQGKSLVFRANRTAAKAIQGYMDHLRDQRSMIVYDTYIYQVELTDTRQTGIDWTNLELKGVINKNPLTLTAKSLGGGAPLGSGMGFNAVYDSGDLSMKALFTFLQSQGNVKTIAQPKLAILSGSKGAFKVGAETNYVAKVGTNTGATVNQTTVETAKVASGLNLMIEGNNYDGTVDTKIEMTLTDLLRFNSFQALGTELNLPQTTNRELKTTVRARAGDMVLMAGINNSRENDDISGLPGSNKSLSLLSRSAKDSARSELVIVLKPKVIYFKNKKQQEVKKNPVAAGASFVPKPSTMQVTVTPLNQPNTVVSGKEVKPSSAFFTPAPQPHAAPIAAVVNNAGAPAKTVNDQDKLPANSQVPVSEENPTKKALEVPSASPEVIPKAADQLSNENTKSTELTLSTALIAPSLKADSLVAVEAKKQPKQEASVASSASNASKQLSALKTQSPSLLPDGYKQRGEAGESIGLQDFLEVLAAKHNIPLKIEGMPTQDIRVKDITTADLKMDLSVMLSQLNTQLPERVAVTKIDSGLVLRFN